MQNYSSNPFLLFNSVYIHRELLLTLIKREIVGKYKGSVFGLLWSFITPLFMLAIYTFVFSYIFQARWDLEMESKGAFSLILFLGLITFNLFAECVNSSAGLIVSNANYVKKVVFPLEILPWVSLGTALFHFCVSLLVWFIASIFVFQTIHFTTLLMPFIILPFICLVLGLTMLFSALGVFVRDISQLLSIIVTAMMFLSPIFFPFSAIPEQFQKFILLNPLTVPITEMRNIIIFNELPNWINLIVYSSLSMLVFVICFIFFQKTRRGFADVL